MMEVKSCEDFNDSQWPAVALYFEGTWNIFK